MFFLLCTSRLKPKTKIACAWAYVPANRTKMEQCARVFFSFLLNRIRRLPLAAINMSVNVFGATWMERDFHLFIIKYIRKRPQSVTKTKLLNINMNRSVSKLYRFHHSNEKLYKYNSVIISIYILYVICH